MIFVIVVYFVLMVIIGIVAARRVKSSEGFYLGGKSFGPWFTAFKFAATLESGVKLVGTPAMAWAVGYPAFLQGMLTPFTYLLSFRVFGQRLKAACDHFKVLTVPQLLEKRYASKVVRILAAIAILVGLSGSLIAQFKASGEIFSSVLGTNYFIGLLIGVLVVGIYSIVGGYVATVWTDLLQGIVMAFGSVILLYAATKAAFGEFSFNFIPKMNAALAEINPSMLELDGGGKIPMAMIVIMFIIGIIMGVAQPQQAVALFSMRDTRVAKTAMIICTIFSTLLLWTILPAAMMGRMILPAEAIKNPDSVIPILTQTILSPGLAGVFIAAILSAIMSTVSGLIVVVAAAISQDILKNVIPKTYEKNQVMWDRMSAAFIVLVCFLLAIKPPAIIFWIVISAFGFTVFTFIMPMLGTVLWKRATGKAAVIQMVATMIVMPIWYGIGPKIAPKVPALLVGLIVAPIVFIIVSLLTKNENEEEVNILWDVYHSI